jgi:RNA recognition motif-containing protein
MQNKLFVRNISYKLTEEELAELFSPYGEVVTASIPKDRDTGRSRGFAFVEMKSQGEAEAAIQGMNNREVQGREMFVAFSESKVRATASAGSSHRY